MNAKYISKDQNWNDGNTTYWFDVDGNEYGIVEEGFETYPVDHNSSPIENEYVASEIIESCVVTDAMRTA
jgi:hypothetical protein